MMLMECRPLGIHIGQPCLPVDRYLCRTDFKDAFACAHTGITKPARLVVACMRTPIRHRQFVNFIYHVTADNRLSNSIANV